MFDPARALVAVYSNDPARLDPPAEESPSICDENCDRNGGTVPCKCYGTPEETTEGGW